MASTGAAAPQEEDWHPEWRWGAAHPWLRPRRAAPSAAVAGNSPPAFSSSFEHTASPAPSPGSSSSCRLPAPSPPAPSSRSSHSSSIDPLSASGTATSSARPPSFVNIVASSLRDTSATVKCPPLAADAGRSTSASLFPPLPPVSFSFSRLLRWAPSETPDMVVQRESVPAAGPQACTADGPPSARDFAGPAARRPPPGNPPAASNSEAALDETDRLRENGGGTAVPIQRSSSIVAGAEDAWGLLAEEIQRSETLQVSTAGPRWRPGSVTGEAPPAVADTRRKPPIESRLATQEAESESGTLEPGSAAGGAVATQDGLPARLAACATSAGTIRADDANREPQKVTAPTREPQMMQQLVLQFTDQTLSFLQKEQLALWSFFAFRDWRVKTLVHALSAMGEPVNLVVVNCTQPPPTSDSSANPSSINAPDVTVGSPSASQAAPSSSPAFSAVAANLYWLMSFFYGIRGGLRTPSPPSLLTPSGEHPDLACSAAGAAMSLRAAAASVPLAHADSSAASGPSLAVAAAAARPSAESGVAPTRMTAEAEPTGPGAPSLFSTSPMFGDDVVRGGYSPLYHTVWLCGNRVWSPFELRRVLLHELVHAFDFARANLSPDSCRHVACTEIRAYNLSGQCGWWRTRSYGIEQFNAVQPLPSLVSRRPQSGQLPRRTQQLEGQHTKESGQWQQTKRNACLTHGALNSLRQHRRCQTLGVAEDAVRDVFSRCVRDTWPFLAPPERDSRWRPSRMWRPEAAEFFKK